MINLLLMGYLYFWSTIVQCPFLILYYIYIYTLKKTGCVLDLSILGSKNLGGCLNFTRWSHPVYRFWLLLATISCCIPHAPWCWNIYQQNWVIFRANVGKYSSTMDKVRQLANIANELRYQNPVKFHACFLRVKPSGWWFGTWILYFFYWE